MTTPSNITVVASARVVDFLAENNVCGQTLLRLVSRANAVIAELLRLSDRVPIDFVQPPNPKVAELLPDFEYFRTQVVFDAKVEENEELQEIDDGLRETHIEILSRFFLVFHSIHLYVSDLNKYVEDVDDGTYLQQTLETILLNNEGRQLLAESLYLYGVILLLLDLKYSGVVRERLLVAYYRYSAQRTSSSEIDDICTLLRSTGYARGGKRPVGYPENYFARVPLNSNFVDMVIGRLRSDDLYNQLKAFPLPDHRSTALASQASMLYVCLFFSPQILHTQTSAMRETVDKYFADNWVISLYMGTTVNLVEAWEPYKAAKSALLNSLQDINIKQMAATQGAELDRLVVGLRQFLSEGTMTKEYILDNTTKLLKTLRKCNVTLRWLMLHTSALRPEWAAIKKCTTLRDVVIAESKFDSLKLFELLLSTAQFELKLKEKLQALLEEKQQRCETLKAAVADHFAELAEVYSGQKPLTRVAKSEKLQKWFLDLKTQVEKLQFETDLDGTGRKLIQLCRQLNDVSDLHSLDSHVSVKQFLAEVNQLLQQLLRALNLKDDTLAQIQIIGDMTYAWETVDQYTKNMQDGIKQDPSLAIKLRATFLKLSSALGLPLLRIEQADSADFPSVSQFYSRELVIYVRRVLQVIPETVFSLLAQIVRLQTDSIQELPAKLEKEKFKEYAKLDDRYEMARLTHAISVLTEGVLMMKTTLFGIIKVDPKQLLEDGIRKELVQQVATTMHQTLVFNPKAKQSELMPKLEVLARRMDGSKRSFAYISDYISLSGLRIWQEEMTRIIGYNVERESNLFLKHKITEEESIYQSRVIPIPRFAASVDTQSPTFMGRIIREILRQTNPRTTVYVRSLNTWYDAKTKATKINPELFKVLLRAVGNTGVSGLDKLCSFMIVDAVQKLSQLFRKQMMETPEWQAFLEGAYTALAASHEKTLEQPHKFYDSILQKSNKLYEPYAQTIAQIGQLQILRIHLLQEVTNAAKFQSKLLTETLQTLNASLLTDLQQHVLDPENKPYPDADNPLLFELTQYLEACGFTDPLEKVYVRPPRLIQFDCFLFLVVLHMVPKLNYAKSVGCLLAKKPSSAAVSALTSLAAAGETTGNIKKSFGGGGANVDGTPFVVGLLTVARQTAVAGSGDPARTLVRHCAQFIVSFVHALNRQTGSKQTFELVPEVGVMLKLLNELEAYGFFENTALREFVPQSLLSEYHACLSS